MHTHTWANCFRKPSTKKIPFCVWSPKTPFSHWIYSVRDAMPYFHTDNCCCCCFFSWFASVRIPSALHSHWDVGYGEKAQRNGIHICNSMKGTRRGRLGQSNSQSDKRFWLQKDKTNSNFIMDNGIANEKKKLMRKLSVAVAFCSMFLSANSLRVNVGELTNDVVLLHLSIMLRVY